jgi:hypothetical protein
LNFSLSGCRLQRTRNPSRRPSSAPIFRVSSCLGLSFIHNRISNLHPIGTALSRTNQSPYVSLEEGRGRCLIVGH